MTSWQVTVDGPPQPIECDKGKLSIPVPLAGRVVFPERPSDFVLVSGKDGKLRDVWRVCDLRTGKDSGEVQITENVQVLTGGAEYGNPMIQRILDIK